MRWKKVAGRAGIVVSTAAAVLGLTVGTAAAATGASSIQEGDQGFGVYCVQWAANWFVEPSYNVPDDGQFGPLTLRLVIQFQEQERLQQDGVVGPLTGTKLWQTIATVVRVDGDMSTPYGVPLSHCYQVLPTTS